MDKLQNMSSPELTDDFSIESRVSELYLSNMDMICEGLPESVNSRRREALESFSLQTVPSKRSERYRHFDLREAMSQGWEHYFTPPDGAVAGFEGLEVDGYEMELLNGFYVGEEGALVELDNGVIYGSLREAFRERKELVMSYYNSVGGDGTSVERRLNTLFMQDGAFVYVPKGVKVDKPFIVTFEYASQEQLQMCFGRMLVVLEQGAEADLVVLHHSQGDAKFMVDFVREADVATEATLNIAEVVAMRGQSIMVGGSYIKQGQSSRTNIMNLWLEGGVTRANVVTDLAGEGCEANLHALYFGREDQRTSIDMNVNHLAANCTSYELVKGVVSDSSIGAFTGRIFVAPDAQRTAAYQHSRNLQLSNSARIYAEPQLEIYADDVKCSHGATLGQLNDDAIYYMRQRGLSERDAERLRLYGFVNDIVQHCPVEGAVEGLRAIVEGRISVL